jgi:hypothetical protein
MELKALASTLLASEPVFFASAAQLKTSVIQAINFKVEPFFFGSGAVSMLCDVFLLDF